MGRILACFLLLAGVAAAAEQDRAADYNEIQKRHDEEAVLRLQTWIRQPSIAAENRGMKRGFDLMIQISRDAGFQRAGRVETDGQPGVLAMLDAGAPGHFGLGHGSGAHAPDEYFVIESANPHFVGCDGAVRAFVDYLYELGKAAPKR